MKNRLFLVSMLALLVCGAVWSQDTRGSIVGRITDPSGAVVPGATIVVTNPATAAKSTVTTNQDGIYRVPLLQPGKYQIEVTSSGFKKAIRNDVEVRVADRIDINIALEIGASEQHVPPGKVFPEQCRDLLPICFVSAAD